VRTLPRPRCCRSATGLNDPIGTSREVQQMGQGWILDEIKRRDVEDWQEAWKSSSLCAIEPDWQVSSLTYVSLKLSIC
jgi:hypothetical protein